MNDDDRDPVARLLETYETAIAEIESWRDPSTAPLLASLRALRERALEKRPYDLAVLARRVEWHGR